MWKKRKSKFQWNKSVPDGAVAYEVDVNQMMQVSQETNKKGNLRERSRIRALSGPQLAKIAAERLKRELREMGVTVVE